ncbi:MAG TPA: segregation/condensation protein A [Planctomycetota bacterium]|jgi:segregation and condensation protein A|nr:segregation/condensation protein A [Planctomycetota bacterium]
MDHHFELANFAGPLDLLLHLVQKEEMDIREVSLVRICDQYFEALKRAKNLDVDTAGEFLVMAATLMSIKARSLLPREEVDLAAELDPEEELIQRLLEYRQLKEATRILDRSSAARDLIHPSRPEVGDAGIPLEEVGVFHLVEAFRKVLADSGLDRAATGTIVADRPLAEYIADLLATLRATRRVAFHEVFKHDTTRIDLIGHFLAVLELMRAKLIHAVQETAFGEIVIEAIADPLPEHWEPAADVWSTRAPTIDEAPLTSPAAGAPANGAPKKRAPAPAPEPDPDEAVDDGFEPLPDVRLQEEGGEASGAAGAG